MTLASRIKKMDWNELIWSAQWYIPGLTEGISAKNWIFLSWEQPRMTKACTC